MSYWVAWTMLQKIRTAMGQQNDQYKLQGHVEQGHVEMDEKPILAENAKAASAVGAQRSQRFWLLCLPQLRSDLPGL